MRRKNQLTALDDGASAFIDIDGVIGWDVSARQFKRDLKALGEVNLITVYISSLGGYIDDGFSIFNALKNHSAEVHIHITGIAASMGSVIPMAGDRITIEPTAAAMIHKPSSIAWGTATEMRKEADVLDTYEDRLVKAYLRRTDLAMNKEELHDALEEETWYTADEFVAAGFADEVFDAAGSRLEESEPDDEGEDFEATAAIAASNVAWLRVAKFQNTPAPVKRSLTARANSAQKAADQILNSVLPTGGSSAATTTKGEDNMSDFTQAELDEAVKKATDEVHDRYAALGEHENASNFPALARIARSSMALDEAKAHMDDIQPKVAAVAPAEPDGDGLAPEAQTERDRQLIQATIEETRRAGRGAGGSAPTGSEEDAEDEAQIKQAQIDAGKRAAERREAARNGGIQ